VSENLELSEIELRPMAFDEILPIWSTQLWPSRISLIEEVSMIRLGGGYLNPGEVGAPSFCGVFKKTDRDGPIAVSSGFRTESEQYRVRGTWVHESFRNLGLGRMLLDHLISHARKERASLVWTLPRKSAWAFYEKLGFEQASPWLGDYEFGPNCFAVQSLKGN
jgi:GNAT superfamily N-acetyltransferase